MDMKALTGKLEKNEVVVCVVGAGYVGLALATEFARKGIKVVAYDVDELKVNRLNKGIDATGEISKDALTGFLSNHPLKFTADPKNIREADFVIITIPTPITKSKKPDLSYVESASKTIGEHLKNGGVVILESTVYPTVTEEILSPILEGASGLVCGKDFRIAYSPERINPSDRGHNLCNIVKVVSGMDNETTEIVAKLYEKVVEAGVYKAKDIKTAEAAKVIENIQRDLNIALMNELALIFGRMGIDMSDVLDAANTKWNFHSYMPGLVGGHCIPVDPYYLVYKAEELGYHPQVILAGRSVNDYMPKHVAKLARKGLNKAGKVLKLSKVLLMGLTFKENVRDLRTSQAKNIIHDLREFEIDVIGYDPLADREEIKKEFNIELMDDLEKLGKIDCVILAVIHDEFKRLSLDMIKDFMTHNPVLIDVRGFFSPQEAKQKGFEYSRL